MLPIFQRSKHSFSLIRRSASEPNKPVYLGVGSVGCRKVELAINNVNCNAVQQRVETRRSRFEHIVTLMFGPLGERSEVMTMFL